jgi:hypothetical protein
MQDTNRNISDLIFKHLIDDLNSEEEQELNKWLEDPYNKLQFDRICNEENIDAKFEQHNEVDVDKDWRRVARRTTHRKLIQSFYKYAAAILLPIGLFLGILFISDSEEFLGELISQVEEDVVVREQAILITNDGTEYTLPNADTTLLVDNVQLKLKAKDLSYQLDKNTESTDLTYNTLKTPKGVRYKLVLADGSAVWLNAESSLKYPVHFSGKQREVFLTEGEAYFDVEKNKEKPFIVNFSDHKIEVLGTEFNVKAYNEEDFEQITLVEGSVSISNDEVSVLLKPNQQARLHKAKAEVSVESVNTDLYTAWKDDVFMYKQERLAVIMRDLERQYDMSIFYESQDMKEKTFSMRVSKPNSFNEILDYLETTEKVRFEIKGNTIIVK